MRSWKMCVWMALLCRLGVVGASLCMAQNGAGFSPAPWLEDLRQLQSEMSSHYAGLDHAVLDRRMDLPGRRKETEDRIRNARDENDARSAIERFLDSFGDGHLDVSWHGAAEHEVSTTAGTNAGLCERLGYKARIKRGLDFSAYPGFTQVASEGDTTFPGGVVRLPDGRVMGTVRIGLLGEHGYRDVCKKAVAELHLAEDAECKDDCKNSVELATGNLLTAAFTSRLDALRKAGATLLLVDITQNDGGSDWVEAVARELTPVLMPASRMGFVRHPHWTKNLKDELNDVEQDRKKAGPDQAVLELAERRLKAAIAESEKSCDATGVWATGKMSCSILVQGDYFASGVTEYAKPGSYKDLGSRTALFNPLRYTYAEGVNRLPLYVLVDSETWSAAEYLAAILQDSHAATVMGEATGGAGCGFTNGGIPVKLKNSGGQVKMPDCARFRADGSDEVDGVIPDVLIPWPRHASDYQRARALVREFMKVPGK